MKQGPPTRQQRGQVITEYVIVAGVLTVALFVEIPGTGQSAVQLLIASIKRMWSAYSFTLSLPL